jgi:hypothetical protein
MRIRVRGLSAVIALVGLWFAVPAFGQTDGSTFNLSVSGPDNSVVVGDGYADPYNGTASYNGSNINPNGLIVCDDYNHNVTAGETWTATGMQASTLTSGNVDNTRFGSSIGLLGYAEVANLVTQLLSTNNQQLQADISSAIWWITSGGTKIGSNYSFDGVSLDANAVALLKAVLGTSSSTLLSQLAKDTNLWIMTPTSGGPNSPQEMWVETPEGGAALMYLLLAALACYGAMFLRNRNRFASGAAI